MEHAKTVKITVEGPDSGINQDVVTVIKRMADARVGSYIFVIETKVNG